MLSTPSSDSSRRSARGAACRALNETPSTKHAAVDDVDAELRRNPARLRQSPPRAPDNFCRDRRMTRRIRFRSRTATRLTSPFSTATGSARRRGVRRCAPSGTKPRAFHATRTRSGLPHPEAKDLQLFERLSQIARRRSGGSLEEPDTVSGWCTTKSRRPDQLANLPRRLRRREMPERLLGGARDGADLLHCTRRPPRACRPNSSQRRSAALAGLLVPALQLLRISPAS